MGFFVMPVLLVAAYLLAVIPSMFLAEKRDQIALAATLIVAPVAADALFRITEAFLLNCTGEGFDDLTL